MRRRWWYIGGGVVALAAVGVIVFLLVFQDTATPVTLDDLTGAAGVDGTEPGDPGVYSYRTIGFEETDAVGGTRHDYPSETFVTIVRVGCGVEVRWQPLQERWDAWEVCDDLTLVRIDAYHEFYGVSDLSAGVCDAGAVFPPVEGETWSYHCDDGLSFVDYTVGVIGVETLEIGGEPIETIHIREVSSSDGRTDGGATIDTWRLRGTALIVRRVVDSNTVTDSRIGDAAYTEQYTIELVSLRPVG